MTFSSPVEYTSQALLSRRAYMLTPLVLKGEVQHLHSHHHTGARLVPIGLRLRSIRSVPRLNQKDHYLDLPTCLQRPQQLHEKAGTPISDCRQVHAVGRWAPKIGHETLRPASSSARRNPSPNACRDITDALEPGAAMQLGYRIHFPD